MFTYQVNDMTCGHCVSACPVQALSMQSPSPDEESPA